MYWRLEEFVVYGIIYDISMLEKRSTNNRFLNCELSFGEDVTNSINKGIFINDIYFIIRQ